MWKLSKVVKRRKKLDMYSTMCTRTNCDFVLSLPWMHTKEETQGISRHQRLWLCFISEHKMHFYHPFARSELFYGTKCLALSGLCICEPLVDVEVKTNGKSSQKVKVISKFMRRFRLPSLLSPFTEKERERKKMFDSGSPLSLSFWKLVSCCESLSPLSLWQMKLTFNVGISFMLWRHNSIIRSSHALPILLGVEARAKNEGP